MAILETLLEITIYSAVIFAAIMLFKKVTRGKLSPVLSFAIWFLLIARLCLPVTIHSGFSFITLPDASPIVVEETAPVDGGQDTPPANANQQITGYTPLEQPAYPYPNHTAPATTGSSTVIDAATESTVTAPVTIANILLLVWGAGAFAMLMWAGAVSSRLDRIVKKRSVPAPGWIKQIYAECRKDLGIKKQLPLLITQNLASPALIVSTRPKLLLPLDFIEKSTSQQIAFAIRHELTHYKRKDHIVCLVMRILNAVYWFNPVVWLAEKQIVLDMETACDSAIVKSMRKEEKKYYAHTILAMFTKRREPRLMLGMALKNSKNIAERRIRGIYMNRKTKGGVRLACLVLVSVMLVACFTTACQPVYAENAATDEPSSSHDSLFVPQAEEPSAAPEDEQEAVEPTAEPEAATEKYVENIPLTDQISVNYNADVIVPAGSIPTATVEIRDFTEADVQQVADYFFAGMDTYAPWARTKSEIQQEIDVLEAKNSELAAAKAEYEADPQRKTDAEAKMEEIGYSGEDWVGNAELEAYMDYGQIEPEYKMNEYYIEKDREELETAPETHEKTPAVIQFADENLGRVGGVESGVETLMDEDIIWNTVRVWAEQPNGDVSEVYGFREGDGARSSIHYSRAISTSEWGIFLNDFTFDPLTISQQDAQAQAQAAVNAICPGLVLAETLADNGYGQYAPSEDLASYTFTFVREVDDVPLTYAADISWGFTVDSDSDDYTSIGYEYVNITVDNDGILGFSWFTPYSNVHVDDADAPVIPMDEAAKTFENFCVESLEASGYLAEEGTELENGAYGWGLDNITLDIDKIQLGLSRVTADDGSYRIIPTWDFFGTANATKDGQPQNYNSFGESWPNNSQCTVNALDGTLADRTGRLDSENFTRW